MVAKSQNSTTKSASRTTHVYELLSGRKSVYIGTAKDPIKRAKQHKAKGKDFSKVKVLTAKMKKANAEKKETSLIRKHKRTNGSLPKYNVSPTGQYEYGVTKAKIKKLVKRIKEVKKTTKRVGGKKK